MRRFILGWKVLGYARCFGAEIVNYADDFCVLGKAKAAEMLAAVNRLMDRLKLPVNAQKTRCLRCPEEPLEFLRVPHRLELSSHGYEEPVHRHSTERGERSEHLPPDQRARRTADADGWKPRKSTGRLNRMISGWANYFDLGQVRFGLQSCGPAGNPAATTVVLAEAQGAGQGRYVRLSRQVAVGAMRPHAPRDEDQIPSEGEGVIATESPVRRAACRVRRGGTGNGPKGAGLGTARKQADQLHTGP